MPNPIRRYASLCLAGTLYMAAADAQTAAPPTTSAAGAQMPAATAATAAKQEPTMTRHASGAFDVKLSPLPIESPDADERRGRMALDKRFHGELDATGVGQMLTATGAVKGSAGYVAIERVEGTLHGRKGSFMLQHSGTMTRGAPSLSITVVPDSGDGELAGIEGRMSITITDGAHRYDFEYRLPDSP